MRITNSVRNAIAGLWIFLAIVASFPAAPSAMAQDDTPTTPTEVQVATKKPVLVELAGVQSASTQSNCIALGRLQPWAEVVTKAFAFWLPMLGSYDHCVNASLADYSGGQMLKGGDTQFTAPVIEGGLEALMAGYNVSIDRLSYTLEANAAQKERIKTLMEGTMPDYVHAWQPVGIFYLGEAEDISASSLNEEFRPPTSAELQAFKKATSLDKAFEDFPQDNFFELSPSTPLYPNTTETFNPIKVQNVCPGVNDWVYKRRVYPALPDMVGGVLKFTSWMEVEHVPETLAFCGILKYYRFVKTTEAWTTLPEKVRQRAEDLAKVKSTYAAKIEFQQVLNPSTTWWEEAGIWAATIGGALLIAIAGPGTVSGQTATYLMIFEPAPQPQAAGVTPAGGETP